MKLKSVFLTVLGLLLSAALGWFLPAGAAAVLDKTAENTLKTVEIEPVSLSYSQDLSISDKLSAIYRGDYSQGGFALSNGIFLKKEEAEQISSQFYADFWKRPESEIDAAATPNMMQSIQGNGLVVWIVEVASANTGAGTIVVDDATGVILTASMLPEHTLWNLSGEIIESRFLSAYNRHLESRNAALNCQAVNMPKSTKELQYYKLRLTAPDGSETLSSFWVSYSMLFIRFNDALENSESLP